MRCLLIFFCFFPFLLLGQFQNALDRLVMSPALRNAAIGVSVKQVTDGKIVAEFNSQMALHPASVMKLIATSVALKEKGGEFRYVTPVYYTGRINNGVLEGDVMVMASGDPCPDSRYFPDYKFTARLVNEIVKLGIKRIEGRILIKGDKPVDVSGSWLWEDISNYYGAVYRDFNYRDNTYAIEFRSGVAGRLAEVVSVKPEQRGVKFVNEVVASVESRDNAWVFGGPYSRELHLKGSIPEYKASYLVKGAIHDPATCFVNEIIGLLRGQGVSVGGKILPNKNDRKELFRLSSPVLREIVFHTNKSSVNLFAEALGCLSPDLSVVLKAEGVDMSGAILKDACGLSSQNAVPASVFTDLLIWADRRLGSAFVESLPIAGVDSGLRFYCGKSQVLKNRLRAKTGSFFGVRCLSGYVDAHSGKRYAFTILINNYTCTSVDLYTSVCGFLESLV